MTRSDDWLILFPFLNVVKAKNSELIHKAWTTNAVINVQGYQLDLQGRNFEATSVHMTDIPVTDCIKHVVGYHTSTIYPLIKETNHHIFNSCLPILQNVCFYKLIEYKSSTYPYKCRSFWSCGHPSKCGMHSRRWRFTNFYKPKAKNDTDKTSLIKPYFTKIHNWRILYKFDLFVSLTSRP